MSLHLFTVLLLTTAVAGASLLGLMVPPAEAYPEPTSLGTTAGSCPPRPADDAGESGGAADQTTIAQELSDACELAVVEQAALDGDLKAVDGDVTAGTKTLDGDLAILDGDVKQLDSDLKAQASADAPSSTVSVSNFPGDQQVSLDPASAAVQDGQAHGIYSGLWVIVGAIVGCFVFGQVLDRLWP